MMKTGSNNGASSTTTMERSVLDGKHERSALVKIYAAAILVLDLLAVILKVMLSVLEAVYYLVVPVREKAVAGEVVLITGTGHGIGRELAFQFSELGAVVVCWDINSGSNEGTVRDLRKMGYRAYGYTCDVSNREQVLEVANKVRAEVGEVTVLVNNAGIMPCHPLTAHSHQEIRRIFDINTLAHFWLLEAFLPHMLTNNHGHVVAISSIAGLLGTPNLVPYCASKFAVRGLMEALWEELRAGGGSVRVKLTTVLPFIVDTGLCHKPRTRFPNLLGIVPPKKAAADIIKAMRRDQQEVSIPGRLLYLNYALRMFPFKAAQIMKDFVDSGVDSHDT